MRTFATSTVAGALALCAAALVVNSAAAAPEPMTRDAIIDLAVSAVDYSYYWGHGSWRTDGTQHGSCSGSCPDCTHSGSYGADCSGFVAKAWQVPNPSPVSTNAHPYSTQSFRYSSTHWSQIDRGTAKRADAMVYRNSSNSGGHIVLYSSGDPWGSLYAYEARGCSPGIVYNLRTCSSSYIAIQRDLLDSAPATGAIKGSIFIDHGDGNMDDRIPGATVSSSGAGSATARPDDAIWVLSGSPGSYTVTASAAGYESNTRSCAISAGQDTWCSIGLAPSCVPVCGAKVCGDDGCGGSCGSCGADETCQGGQCACVPSCDGKSCGGDGCGGSCGSCGDSEQCQSGQCVCEPQCGDAECGPDPVCGEPCGLCEAGHACAEGVCACEPDCSNVECGADPVCGQGCGLCDAGLLCNGSGECVDPGSCAPDCDSRECGADPVCGVSCGSCGLEQVCGSTGLCTDIFPDLGKVHGHVYEVDPLHDERHEWGPPVAGAQVGVIDSTITTADDQGYFELQLAPGLLRLVAEADGYSPGAADCEVAAGLSIECDLPVYLQDDPRFGAAAAKQKTERYEVGGFGCASLAPNGVLALLVLIPLAVRRRRSA